MFRWLHRAVLFGLLFSPAAGFVPASFASDTRQPSLPTLKANTRLVVVDIVVRDSHGNAVTDLTRDAFAIVEDGKPQTISSFEFHAAPRLTPSTTQTAPPAAPAKRASNIFTNVSWQTPGPLNLLLVDGLNTQLMDQAYTRQQLVKFLATLPSGQPVAIFTLGSHLELVEGVTSDRKQLASSVDKLLATRTSLLTTPSEQTDQENDLLQAQMAGINVQHLRDFLAEQESIKLDNRVRITLEALRQISRAVAGYPGRKNLIWISGGFPFQITPDSNALGASSSGAFASSRNYAGDVRETASLLASGQIAVYPVDARGLDSLPMDATMPGAVAIHSGSAIMTARAQDLRDTHTMMNDIASQTGGKAFYNTNDIAGAVTAGIDQGSSYYTLAYTPQNAKWDGRFRHIQVKVDRKGLELAYRHGYYSVRDDAPVSSSQLDANWRGAFSPDTLPLTAIPFKVFVEPPALDGKLVVRYLIAGNELSTRDANDKPRKLLIEFAALAWDRKGKDAGHILQTVQIGAGSKLIPGIEQHGLAMQQELLLSPGATLLRVGVMDRNSGRIGTLDITLPITAAARHSGG